MAKYWIKLVCGHDKIAFDVSPTRTSGYFCADCCKEQKRDMSIPANRISVGATNN